MAVGVTTTVEAATATAAAAAVPIAPLVRRPISIRYIVRRPISIRYPCVRVELPTFKHSKMWNCIGDAWNWTMFIFT